MNNFTRIVVLVLLCAGSMLWAFAQRGYSMDSSAWPMFQHDPGHTGLAPMSVSDNPRLLWRMDLRNLDGSHLLLGEDGSLWTVSDWTVRKIGRFGGIRFRFELDRSRGVIFNVQGAAAVLPGGGLVCLGNVTEGKTPVVYNLDKEANLQWSLQLDGQTNDKSLLTLGNDGTIYLGLGSPLDAATARLYAISEDGDLLWSYQPPAAITGFPAVDADGTVYLGCQGAVFCAVDPPGVLKWSFDAKSRFDSRSPTIDQSGNVYFLASMAGLFAFRKDGSNIYSYPAVRFCHTSPVILPDGAIAFLSTSADGPTNDLICLNQDGKKRWVRQIPGSTILVSPIADQNGNVYLASFYGDPPKSTCYLGRVDMSGTLEILYSHIGQPDLAGPCIDSQGTIYCWMEKYLIALGQPTQTAIGISTDMPSFTNSHDVVVTISLSLMNPAQNKDVDAYIAYQGTHERCLRFWPFWLSDPNTSALKFRTLPRDALFPCVQVSHLRGDSFKPGTYQAFAGLFEHGTMNPVGEIAWTTFDVMPTTSLASKAQILDSGPSCPMVNDRSIYVSLATDKATYHAGDVLHLTLSLDNQGLGIAYDLYIAATLDDDPNGTLFFFPTWQTDPSLANISFLPLVTGASLPSLTIMHLELPDALPKGSYRFLAAFFHHGTFDLASNVAEAHWTLM